MVAHKNKHLLRQESLCDEELLSGITKAVSHKQEKDLRLGKSKNTLCIYFSYKTSSSNSKRNSRIVNFVKLRSIVESLTMELLSFQSGIINLKGQDLDKKCVICNETNINRCTRCYL